VTQDGVPFEAALANDSWLLRPFQVDFGLRLRRRIETGAVTGMHEGVWEGAPKIGRTSPSAGFELVRGLFRLFRLAEMSGCNALRAQALLKYLSFRSPPPLPVFSLTLGDLRNPRGSKKAAITAGMRWSVGNSERHGWRSDAFPLSLALPHTGRRVHRKSLKVRFRIVSECRPLGSWPGELMQARFIGT
jgi:hypothetical protein